MNEDSIDQKQHLSFLSSVESNTKQFEIEKEELNSFNYQLKQKDYIILKGNAQSQPDINEEKDKYSFCKVKAVNDSIVNFNNKKAQEKYHVNSLNKENSKESLFDLNKTEWSDNKVKKCSNNQEEVISNFHCFLHNKTENEETDSILRTNSLSRLNEKEQLKTINGYHSLEENQTNSNKLQDLTLDSLPSNEVVLKDLSQEAQQNLNQGSFLNFTTPQNIKTGLHFSSRNITQFTKSTTVTEPTNSYSPQRKIELNLSPKLAITDFESRLNLATFEIKEDSAMKNVENDGIVLNEKKVLTKKAQDNMMQLLNNSSLNTMNNIQTSSKSNYVGIDNMMASDSRTDMLVYKESISQEIENKKDIENEQRRYDEGRKVIDTKEDNLKDMIHSEKQEDWDKVIRIDVATAFQKYEEFARKKAPKYIKKIQKNLVKISKLLKKFGIIDETILELKKEVSHLNSWTSSWTFSRILLYLYNILGCLTYNYNMNREQFQKTDFKQWFRLVKRTYYYVKLVMEILLIKFDGEEIDAFHRLRREFRTHLQEKINKVTEERLRQLNENVPNKIDENRKDWLREKDIIKQRNNQEITNLEPLLMKKVKGSQSFGLIPNTSKEKKRKSLDEENYESSGSEEYKIKTKRTLEEKLAPVKKKKQKQGALKENELKFKILIGKSLQECLNKVTNHYKSKEYIESLQKEVMNSWITKPIEESKNMEEIINEEIAKPRFFRVELDENKLENNMTSTSQNKNPNEPKESTSYFSFNIINSYPFKPKNLSNKLSIFEINNEESSEKMPNDRGISSSSTTSQRKEILNPYKQNYPLGILHLKESILLGSPCLINFERKFEKNVSAVFLSNKVEKRIHGYLKLKGITYQFNLDPVQDDIINKLVLLKIELRQNLNESVTDLDERQDKLDGDDNEKMSFKVSNSMTVESYNQFLNLHQAKRDTEFTVKNYKGILDTYQTLNKLTKINFLEEILNQLKKSPWRFQTQCALYYYAQFNHDLESNFCSWEIGILTVVENFLQFHVEINDKKIF